MANYRGPLWVIDTLTHAVQTQTVDLDISALDTADLHSDGIAEILIGTTNGLVNFIDPIMGGVDSSFSTFGIMVNGLRVADVLGDSAPELIFVSNGFLNVRTVGGQPLWTSERFNTLAGGWDSLLVADIDEDGRSEIVVNIGLRGMRVYEVQRRAFRPVNRELLPRGS